MSKLVKVQLLYFPGCPNVEVTRKALGRALKTLSLGATPIEELNVNSGRTPGPLRQYPSPTILINGNDIEGVKPGDYTSCRVYAGGTGGPAKKTIEKALRAAMI